MKPERYARLQEIVEGARELRGDQLEAYLESTCSGDDKLREEARTLLVAGRDSEAGIFGERSIDGVRLELGGLFADGHGPALLPTVIGPYRILRQIGRGGMGIVYEARQEGPDRTVALKVLRPELVDGGLLKRFHQEAEVLALLQHPGVARIFDAGTCNLGGGEMPYFAMELIEGQELGEFARSHDLGLRARVRLVARICEAVQHAHERGVIHRDLKPANVLVVDGTGHDGPRPVVLDFGIARSTDPERQRQKHWTQTGQVLGTLDYMSPEQLDGFGEVVDQRADIYALGVILYELLCGRLPLDLEGTSLASVGRVIRDVEPARLGTLRPECRGDLEVVCAKALRKERALRYGSAAEFGEDLNRFLADQPVSARPSSTWYQVVKFARRNRAFVTSVAVAFAVLAIGVAVSVPLAVYAERSEQSARDSLSRFEIKVSEFDQLAGVAKLESAIERERALFPAWPHMTSALEQWLDGECDSLLAMRPKMKQTTEQFASAPGGVTAATSARFLNDALVKLLEDLAGFESQQKANVERRLRWAAGVREWTRFHPGARVSWQTVAAQIAASTKYVGRGIELDPEQLLGLVPLGQNPVTGLQEFYHLRSAWDGNVDPASLTIPVHQPDGSIEMADETGMVFVLLPGGNQLVSGILEELHVEVAPFLLARHEMTQGQWQRLWSGASDRLIPSSYFIGGKIDIGQHFTAKNPVETVGWEECDTLLAQHGLMLPTVQQWQHGARAGSTGRFFFPEDEVRRYANIADLKYQKMSRRRDVEDYDDGFAMHAPVGRFLPNALGFYDVHGNVKEWLADETGIPIVDEDWGKDPDQRHRVGGGYSSSPQAAEVGFLDQQKLPGNHSVGGLRAARSLRTVN